MYCILIVCFFLFYDSPHTPIEARRESVNSSLVEYVGLAHIDLLDQRGGELVQFLVEQFLLALLQTAVLTAMLLQEVLEHVLGEQAHDLAEVLGDMHLADVADYVGQTLLSDVGFHFGDESLQGITVGNGFGKQLVAFLHTLFLGEPFVLALDEHPAAVPEIHRHDRSDDDALADVVLDGRQTQPFGNLALESVRVFETFTESALEQSPGIEEPVLLEKTVHFDNRQIPAALAADDIDVEGVKLMLRGVVHALLDGFHLAVGLHFLVGVGATEHLTKDADAPCVGEPAHHLLSESDDLVPVSLEQFRIVIKLLVLLQQGRTLGKPHALSVAEEAGVGAMHLFLYHVFQVGGHLCHDPLHKLPAEGVLDGTVLLEL